MQPITVEGRFRASATLVQHQWRRTTRLANDGINRRHIHTPMVSVSFLFRRLVVFVYVLCISHKIWSLTKLIHFILDLTTFTPWIKAKLIHWNGQGNMLVKHIIYKTITRASAGKFEYHICTISVISCSDSIIVGLAPRFQESMNVHRGTGVSTVSNTASDFLYLHVLHWLITSYYKIKWIPKFICSLIKVPTK